MSIAPVQGFQAARAQSENATVEAVHPHVQTASRQANPVSGTSPKQENAPAKNTSENYELPQDVVEVHQDPLNKGQVIIQYLDKAGDVIVQVPSSQELAVERGIAQDFEQAAKLRASTAPTAAYSSGGKTHGN